MEIRTRIGRHVFCFVCFGLTNSARAQNTNPLTDASMIALQVVRTSFGFHLRECMGSCFPPPVLHTTNNLHSQFTLCQRAN